ncbi:MAG: hypothetical protein LBR74_01940 [Eubacterium sp.]|jgi:hypothetical protein|nr:hypothetical protein [Eubacterium sp.]
MSYIDDKKELLKLKQGLIDKNKVVETEKPIKTYEKPKGFKAKISNYWYHYKWHTLGGIAAILVIVLILFEFLTKKNPDIEIIALTDNSSTYNYLLLNTMDLEDSFLQYTPDYDKNGYTNVAITVIDISDGEYTDPDMALANSTKLAGEIQRAETLIFIGNKQAFYSMPGNMPMNDIFINFSTKYTSCEFVEDEYFYKIKGSPFETAYNLTNCPDDFYIAMRRLSDQKNEPAQQRARTVISNIINNNFMK